MDASSIDFERARNRERHRQSLNGKYAIRRPRAKDKNQNRQFSHERYFAAVGRGAGLENFSRAGTRRGNYSNVAGDYGAGDDFW